jgi:hypothetical protein
MAFKRPQTGELRKRFKKCLIVDRYSVNYDQLSRYYMSARRLHIHPVVRGELPQEARSDSLFFRSHIIYLFSRYLHFSALINPILQQHWGCQEPRHPSRLHDSPAVDPEEQLAIGVTQDYVRLASGLEDVEDIKADIDQALNLSQQ